MFSKIEDMIDEGKYFKLISNPLPRTERRRTEKTFHCNLPIAEEDRSILWLTNLCRQLSLISVLMGNSLEWEQFTEVAEDYEVSVWDPKRSFAIPNASHLRQRKDERVKMIAMLCFVKSQNNAEEIDAGLLKIQLEVQDKKNQN